MSQNIGTLTLIIICLNIGTPDKHHFPFGTNGKVVVFGVPILKHFRVYTLLSRAVSVTARISVPDKNR